MISNSAAIILVTSLRHKQHNVSNYAENYTTPYIVVNFVSLAGILLVLGVIIITEIIEKRKKRKERR